MIITDCSCEKSFFELFNEFLVSFSHLLWPLIVLFSIIYFRKEVSHFISRLKSAKFSGVEFDAEKEELKKESEIASESVRSDEKKDLTSENEFNVIRKKYLNDPKVGIMFLASEIEKETRVLSKALNLSPLLVNKSTYQAFDLLSEKGYLTKPTVNSVKIFNDLRNKVVHGFEVDASQLLVVFDSGITILKTLKAIPRHRQFVVKANIDLYSDEKCNILRSDVKGVIIKNITPGGAIASQQIFPTLKKDYIDGMEVSWAWSFEHTWDSTWYKDYQDGTIKMAWGASAEYVGTPILE